MLKYEGKGHYKVLSIVLALVMLLTTPIGTIQVNALEEGQPEVVQRQEEFKVEEPLLSEQDMNSNVMGDVYSDDIVSDNICVIDETKIEYPSLDLALNAIDTRGTIRLLKDVNHSGGIVIDGKSITFYIKGFTLNISSSIGPGIEVKNKGWVDYIGSGQFNVTSTAGGYEALLVREDSFAKVSNLYFQSGSGAGAYADGDGSIIHVDGDIISGGKGVMVFGAGQITVDGTIKYKAGQMYVDLYHDNLLKDEGILDISNGYYRYNSSKTDAPGIVWVKNINTIDANICEIGGTGYPTLDEALENVKTNETIKLLEDINYNKGILIDSKNITFNVGEFTLNVVNSPNATNLTDHGLEVKNGGNVYLIGDGEFNVSSTKYGGYGVVAQGTSSATVTNAKADNIAGHGVFTAGEGDSITVLDDVIAKGSDLDSSYGALTWNGGHITIHGSIVTSGKYIGIGLFRKFKSQGALDLDMIGYLKYSDATRPGVVWVKGEPVTTYPLTITNGIADRESYGENDMVTIMANPPEQGYKFKEWLISEDVTFKDYSTKTWPTAYFVMPANQITVEALYELKPIAETYEVVVNGSYADESGAGIYEEDAIVTINAGSRSNYSFAGWTSTYDIEFEDVKSATTNFTMIDQDVEVTATWNYEGGSSSGGGKRPTKKDTVVPLKVEFPNKFIDMIDHWAMDMVNKAVSMNIVNGINENTFEPNRNITRAEFATIIARELGLINGDSSNLADVNNSDWFYNDIMAVHQIGIMGGYEDGNMRPNNHITRQEAMVMIDRVLQTKGMSMILSESEIGDILSEFIDSHDISEWARRSVVVCIKNSIVEGNNGLMRPEENMTRAEAVKILMILLDLIS